jgi:hypothetical protein
VANTVASCAPTKPKHNPGNQRADELYGTKADTTQKKREREAQHKGLAMVKRSRRCSWSVARKMAARGRLRRPEARQAVQEATQEQGEACCEMEWSEVRRWRQNFTGERELCDGGTEEGKGRVSTGVEFLKARRRTPTSSAPSRGRPRKLHACPRAGNAEKVRRSRQAALPGVTVAA